MKIKEVMTMNPVWVKPETLIREVSKKMNELGTGALLIGDGKKLLGMTTDRDIVLGLANGLNPDTAKVTDVMTPKVLYCFQGDKLETAADSMEHQQVHRLAVLDNETNKKLVGVISLGDIAKKTHDKNLCGEIIEQISQ